MTSPADPQLAAFRRLLDDAHRGGQVKVDALLALSQRTVFVVPWPGGIEGWRTLVNRDGVAALPIFTQPAELEEAARRYGWLDGRGAVDQQEVGARAAFNYAMRENLAFVVLDIAAPHALEITRAELEPLITAAARRDSQGPYAGAGKISSTLIRAVRNTPPPTRAPNTRTPAPPVPAVTPPSALPATLTAAGAAGAVAPLGEEPSEELMDALTAVLRNFPEAEWACLVRAAVGTGAWLPAVGVRVDAGFRQRVNEMITQLRDAGAAQGASLEVILLDDATLMRNARGQGIVFYPWRKK